MTITKMTQTNKIVGIDYSMTCPAVCIQHNTEEWTFDTCEFYFLTDVKKHIIQTELINSEEFPLHKSQEERFDNISNLICELLAPATQKKIFIEGYSMGSKGKVFHIAENVGLLKHKLWSKGWGFTEIPPTSVKQFATGKGNSDKFKMFEAFEKEVSVDSHLSIHSTPGKSPSSDIVDAYFICKMGFYLEKGLINQPVKKAKAKRAKRKKDPV